MTTLLTKDLPAPPAQSHWLEHQQPRPFPDSMPDGRAWPRISIVTPSFNQGRYLEATIRSVLVQGYPNLEYLVLDGGSTDDSPAILRKYEPWLAYAVSEKDEGQSDAINRGFSRTTGEIMAYINSDDLYMPYTLGLIGRLFTVFPEVDWITAHSSFLVDENVVMPRLHHVEAYNQQLMRLGFNVPSFLGIPQQVSTFWRRSLYEKAGGRVNPKLWHSMDVDLWTRMAEFTAPVFLPAVTSLFRLHAEQKSQNSTVKNAEIETVGHPFLPYHLRRLLYSGMRLSGVRSVMRRMLFPGTARQFHWHEREGYWRLRTVWAY